MPQKTQRRPKTLPVSGSRDSDNKALHEAELRILEVATNNSTELYLQGLNLPYLPESIGSLKQLKVLDVFYNRITALPKSFDQLGQLQRLVVAGNLLKDLPESLRHLKDLRQLWLHGNDDLRLQPEVISQTNNPTRILNYYFRTRRGWKALNEAKLILVGRGGAGKTSLVKRLIYDTFNNHEPETPGISIEPWIVKLPSREKVRLHVWDFGGQRILHGTHQFFLTARTLYMLVLSAREDNATQDAEYWLQLIRSLGGASRVIIVLNKSDLHPFDINRGLLLEKYPFIVDFVKVDCMSCSGISDIRQLVFQQIESMEHRQTAFPSRWFRIKERLWDAKDKFVEWEQYQEICRRLGEKNPHEQRELAEFLHILGIALHYGDDPRLKDTRVLKPTWVTDGIYTLLRSVQRTGRGGVLTPADVAIALSADEYPVAKHGFLLGLMEKFQLCFRLPGNLERYLVPELLNENQPNDIRALLEISGLGFRYQYEVLPEGGLPRFIVQTNMLSELRPDLRWRTGVVLDRDGCRAVIRADRLERRVNIHIVGSERARRDLLAIIRDKFSEQHRELSGVTVEERVPIADEPGVTVSYRHLLLLEEEGEDEWCRPEGSQKRYRIRDLLNGVESEEDRRRRRTPDVISPDKISMRTDQKAVGSRGVASLIMKCRVLFLAADPERTQALALDEECREIEQKIRASTHRDALELVAKWAVRPDDLLQYLNQHRPSIVHFSCHGSMTDELFLFDRNRRMKAVSKEALEHLFSIFKDNIRVVVLNSCFSKSQAEAIAEVVDCAIGVNRAIGDKAAITFAAAFYQGIGFGRSVQEAFEQGNAALILEGIPKENCPVLALKRGVDPRQILLLPNAY